MARTPRVKLVPPRLPASHVRRPELETLLLEAENRRLTSIVAGPGFGKSTLAASVAAGRGWAWYLVDRGDRSVVAFARGVAEALGLPVDEGAFAGGGGRSRAVALATTIAELLERSVDEERVLVLDDVHELGTEGASAQLLESLVRQAPPELHLLLCSREEPPFAVDRLRGQGQVLDVDASSLSFSQDEAVEVVGPELGLSLHDLTAGWPAAVQLAAEMLQPIPEDERPNALAEVSRSRGPLISYVAEEVVSREPAHVHELLRVAAQFDRFSAELCEAVGTSQPPDILEGLSRRGLVAVRSAPKGWLSMHALLRDFVRERFPLAEEDLRHLHLAAARWFGTQGLLREALSSLKIVEDPEPLASFLDEHWRRLIDGGFADAVIETADLLPDELLHDDLLHLIGRCHALLGRTGEALEYFSRLPPGPHRAFQIADVHMQRGESAEAFDVLLGEAAAGSGQRTSIYHAFIAFLSPSLGELVLGEREAAQALQTADQSGDLGHLADAHAAVADVAQARGDVARAERHYRAARDLGERSGNILALCAVQVKTARLWTVRGRYADALGLVDAATEAADAVGFAQMRSEGRHVRALILARLARFDDAAAELSAADSLDELAGRSGAWDLVAHGDLERARGDVARARLAYETALRAAHPRAVRLRSIALGGLARMLAVDDRDHADELAREGVELSVNERPDILVAAGWVALRRGELARADELAREAADDAARRHARPVLAEALELRAFCSGRPEIPLLEEALALWRELGAPVAAKRVELALARISGAKLEAERVERELKALGVRDTTGRAASVLMAAGAVEGAPLVIQTLGGFGVLRHGEPMPPEAWKSRKARELLKILAARRGKPVARDELIEALWPEEDPTRTGNRLSVALSTLRSVLDPQRTHGPDHFVGAGDGALRLSLESVELDVESFLDVAEQGLRAWRSGAREDALPLLELTEAAYTGDFLEEDRYEDWAEALRNEARAVYVEVLRALAEATRSSKYFLRIIDRDPYDEPAHLALVEALEESGAHGEARRAYGTYVARMQEIGAEPATFPAPALSRV
jgi:ATP/maltotriose-dependent transcriptional regulator MalT/DNA-binding SARP family transcriptional activator